MGKRNNKVWVEGTLSITEVTTTELNESTVPVVTGIIATGLLELGGHHRFIAYGRLVVETIAFVRAIGETEPPRALIVGWLRSMVLERDQTPTDQQIVSSIVVADNITFVVSEKIRTRAKKIINQVLQGESNLGDLNV